MTDRQTTTDQGPSTGGNIFNSASAGKTLVMTVPADGLAPVGARPSATTVITIDRESTADHGQAQVTILSLTLQLLGKLWLWLCLQQGLEPVGARLSAATVITNDSQTTTDQGHAQVTMSLTLNFVNRWVKLVIIVPADVLAPVGSRPSAATIIYNQWQSTTTDQGHAQVTI